MAKDIEIIDNLLEKHIKESIKSDIFPLLRDKNQEEIGGYFAVPMLVFNLVEYLGVLYQGEYNEKSNSIYAVNFIRKYFGDVNKRYREIGGLLYDMFRHGTVHERQPKQYIYSDNNGFGWMIVKNERYSQHLTLYKGLYLLLVLDVLYDDLLQAIDLFKRDLKIKTNVEQRAKFLKAYHEMKKPKKVVEKQKKAIMKNDFQIIRKELRKIF